MNFRQVHSEEERKSLIDSLQEEESSSKMLQYLASLQSEKECQLDLLSFDNIGLVLGTLLDKYMVQLQVARIYSVFEVANRLYYNRRKSLQLDALDQVLTMQKIYLVSSLRSHPVWGQSQFWESLMIY